jgi:hypothetical protein
MKDIFPIFFASIFILSLISGCAAYPDYADVEIRGENVWFKVSFSDKDRRLIRNHYKLKYKRLPPGLAKKGKLPPGLEKQLKRKGKLPPGLQHRLLPLELVQKLSPLPRGYIRLKVGGDVILLDEFTRVVVDIVYDLDR